MANLSQPLADAELEAAAQIHFAFFKKNTWHTIRNSRSWVLNFPKSAHGMLAEARRQLAAPDDAAGCSTAPADPRDAEIERLRAVLVKAEIAINTTIMKIVSSVGTYLAEPPDSDFQHGYMDALKDTAQEHLRHITNILPEISATLKGQG